MAQGGIITVTSQPNITEISDTSLPPFANGSNVEVLGNSYSNTTFGSNYVVSNVVHTMGGDSVMINVETSLFLGTQSSRAFVNYHLYFTVGAEDLNYMLTGGYSSTDGLNLASARVYDETAQNWVVASSQDTTPTPFYGAVNYPFGGSNGFFNSNIGSPSGILLAGHVYTFNIWNEVKHTQRDSGIAGGSYTLLLSTIPEPSSALLLIGAGSIVTLVRRRRA